MLFKHMLKANRVAWLQYYEKSLTYSCVERLSQLNSPLYLVYGAKDFINHHLRFYQNYPHQLTVVKKVSHQVLTKEWKVFNQLIVSFTTETFK